MRTICLYKTNDYGTQDHARGMMFVLSVQKKKLKIEKKRTRKKKKKHDFFLSTVLYLVDFYRITFY